MFNNQIIAGSSGQGGGSFYSYSIDQSLRFDRASSSYLTRTPSSAGNRKTFTLSFWYKNCDNTNDQVIWGSRVGSNDQFQIHKMASGALDFYNQTGGSITVRMITSSVFRDVGAWYHIVLKVDVTTGTSANAIYVNGVEQPLTTDTSSNANTYVNSTIPHQIGRWDTGGYINAYMAEVNFIDGTALDPTSFGETINGIWVPKAYDTADGAYGTNGFYLSFADSAAIGDDLSGNTNDFTVNNLAATDVVPDSPTNNFTTLNPLANFASVTFADGNLYHSASGNNRGMLANWVLPKSGKWYWEHYSIQFHYPTDNEAHFVGINTPDVNLLADRGGRATAITVSSQSGPYDGSSWVLNVRNGSYGSTGWDENEGVGVVYDADAQTIAWKVNGGTTTTPISVPDGDWIPWVGTGGSTGSEQGVFNFGQDGTFSGRTTSGNYTDANGYGNFKWEPPSDALALCTANLPEPAIGPNSTTTSDEHFNTLLYTGDGTTSRSITGVGFAPDFVWGKCRSNPEDHILSDTVRGANKKLESNNTGAEDTSTAATLSGFESDGFTGPSSTPGNINVSGRTYVAWNWKAGGTAVSNTSGSITSSVSANQDAGFSIVSYTGTGANATVGHGLSSAPDLVIVKNRSIVSSWLVRHSSLTASQTLLLENTTGVISTNYWQSTQPDSSVFYVSSNSEANGSTNNLIAYCFANTEGHLKCGSYVGNGSADGTFVYTGFRPAWVMIKKSSGTDGWSIYDSAREPINVMDTRLSANSTDVEVSGSNIALDFISNGFKLRGTGTTINTSGQTYIFLAFAEAPAKYSNAR